MTPSDIKKKAVPFLKKRDATFVGLFGSHARRSARASSDVDLLVRFGSGKTFIELVQIERELSIKLNRKVDLVTEGALSPYIKNQVMNDLVLLYGRR